jgi:3-oxoacyl-[acyl-carrier-protein] synthase III
MRFDPPVWMRGCCAWLPPITEPATEAVAAGRIDADDAARGGYTELPCSPDLAAPEMAVLAAQAALSRAAWDADSIDLLVHAHTWYQGHDFWSPVAYIQDQIGATAAVGYALAQMCNGGTGAIELAATRLAADERARRALITTADRFAAPGFDRWAGDYGVAYGDGATAMLLSREPGDARLLSSVTLLRGDLERMHRGDDQFSPAPGQRPGPVDVRRTKKAFLARAGRDAFSRAALDALRLVIKTSLDEASIEPSDPRVRWCLAPRLGRHVLNDAYLPVLEINQQVATPSWGTRTGHLGAGDVIANLADLLSCQDARPGDIALLIGAGAGFSWSCTVAEITRGVHDGTGKSR